MFPPDNFLYFITLFTFNLVCAVYLLYSYNRTRILTFNAIVFLILAARSCSEYYLPQKEVIPYNPRTLRISDIVDEVFFLFKNVAKEKSIQLVSNVPPELQVYADFNALNTIVRNLVDNAVKYTRQGGTVKINAYANEGTVQIKVADTGVGISSEKLHDIFTLQENKSELGTAGEKGTGLGLHLVYELVKLNAGSVRVDSELGKGTSFELSLPIANLRAA